MCKSNPIKSHLNVYYYQACEFLNQFKHLNVKFNSHDLIPQP